MKVGARVRIRIRNRRVWSRDAANAFNDKVGTVEEISSRIPPDQFLVRFDEPAVPWWRGQSTPFAWWFDEADFITITEG